MKNYNNFINEKNWYAENPSIKYSVIREKDDQLIFNGDLNAASNVYYYHKADGDKCYILKHTIETINQDQLKLAEEITKYNI